LGRQICADQSNEAGPEKEFHNVVALSMRCGLPRAWIQLSSDNELLIREGVTAPGAD
jgi:hypothetical protein